MGEQHAPAERVTPRLLRGLWQPHPGGDKEDKGRLLVIGGSTTTPGAVILAAESALRVGAGKVQVATTATTAVAVAVAVPEAFVVGLDAPGGELGAASADRLLELADGADAVLVGCGMGDPDAACELLEALAPSLDTALAVDALATAFLTAHPTGLRHLAGRAVTTPNLGELARVLHEDEDDVGAELLAATRRAASATEITVLSGGAVSYVTDPSGGAWAVDVAAPGAAVAGSGDVKAGAVAGVLAQGAGPVPAAGWGSYLHARAGVRLTASVGRVGFLAREVSAALPHEVARLTGRRAPGVSAGPTVGRAHKR